METEEIIELLERIVAVDQTPPYEYRQARQWDGEYPPSGQRWLTPREIAQSALKQIRGGTHAA